MVLARGSLPADVLFVGEAPGQSEDALGLPFVGSAGQLLDKIIERALEAWNREGDAPQVRSCFANLVACYPREAKKTDDHKPPDAAIRACQGRLRELIEIAKPRLVVAVGTLARDWLDSKKRHALRLPEGIKCVHVVHPSFILQSNVAARSLLIKKCVVTIQSAVEDL